MGKRETKQTYEDTRREKAAADARYAQAQAESASRIGAWDPILAAERQNLISGYSNLKPFGSLDARSIDVGELKTTLPRLRQFADTGGFTPERLASLEGTIGGLKEFGRTGGLTEENISRMRGMGGFDEFAKTGGYTPESIANIKAQALSPIGSYATGTREELDRRRALQGGYAPGFDAANRQLQRQTSRAIADTSLAANVGIQDRINEGRQWGIGGLAQAEGAVAGLQSGNKLAGMQAAGGLELQLQDTISRYRAMGLSMEQATAQALAEFDAMNVQNQMMAGQFNILNAQNMQMAGLGGLRDVYGTGVGQYENELDRRNSLLGGRTQANLGYLGNQSNLAVQPGIGGNLLNAAGTAAGIGSQFFLPRPPAANTWRGVPYE